MPGMGPRSSVKMNSWSIPTALSNWWIGSTRSFWFPAVSLSIQTTINTSKTMTLMMILMGAVLQNPRYLSKEPPSLGYDCMIAKPLLVEVQFSSQG